MRISPRIALLGLFAVPALLLGADKLQDALAGLESKDASTYEKAAEFLAKHPQQARDPLRKLLQQHDDKDALTRFRAAKLLGDLNDQGSTEVMKKVLFSGLETNAAVRVEMIRALAKLGRKEVIIAYSNSGLEKSATVTAAIALALQGSADEDSKAELGRLLSSTDDERVSRAAVFAISKIYEPVLEKPQNAMPSRSSGLSKTASSGGKLAPPPPPPSTTADDKAGNTKAKLEPTAADKAIFAALKAKGESKNPAISKEAVALLQEISGAYKQP
jgi:HEAT repeat protein